jgi:hypothetical protein
MQNAAKVIESTQTVSRTRAMRHERDMLDAEMLQEPRHHLKPDGEALRERDICRMAHAGTEKGSV